MLKGVFTSLLNKYTSEKSLIETLWGDIEKHYTSQKRHYHNLQHLENMLFSLKRAENKLPTGTPYCFLFFTMTLFIK